jgi:hypothetical protein
MTTRIPLLAGVFLLSGCHAAMAPAAASPGGDSTTTTQQQPPVVYALTVTQSDTAAYPAPDAAESIEVTATLSNNGHASNASYPVNFAALNWQTNGDGLFVGNQTSTDGAAQLTVTTDSAGVAAVSWSVGSGVGLEQLVVQSSQASATDTITLDLLAPVPVFGAAASFITCGITVPMTSLTGCQYSITLSGSDTANITTASAISINVEELSAASTPSAPGVVPYDSAFAAAIGATALSANGTAYGMTAPVTADPFTLTVSEPWFASICDGSDCLEVVGFANSPAVPDTTVTVEVGRKPRVRGQRVSVRR